MSDVKWIKITTGMFDDEKIKIIESMPDADAVLVIWIKLLTLAGKCNDDGYVTLCEDMPFSDEMLATIFHRPLSTIRLALSIFQKYKMIKIADKDIKIVNWDKHQNIDGLDRIREQGRLRMAEYRKRHKHNNLAYEPLNNGICQYCGGDATGYDHIIPISQGGSNDETNLVDCCSRCNRIKNKQDIVRFLSDSNIKLNPFIKKELALKNENILSAINSYVTVTSRNALEKSRVDKNNIYVHSPLKEASKSIPPDPFEALWQAYPKKLGRKQSEKHFHAELKKGKKPEDILKAIENYKSYIKDHNVGEQYIKHGSTFFNNWEDYLNYEPPKPKIISRTQLVK
jgi:predicted phage replisome organizer